MVIVYKYGYGEPEPSPEISPFVVKLETWLRFSGIPYETRTGSSAVMPKGKLPVARVGADLIADSTLIIEHLRTPDFGGLDDTHLGARQRAQTLAIQALFETHLYFVGLYMRWCVDRNFIDYSRPRLLDYANRSTSRVLRPLVPVLLPLVLPLVRRKRRRQAWGQAIARHNLGEVVQIGIAGWTAVAELLGEQDYLLGDRPSTVDATGFAFVHCELVQPVQSAVNDFIRSQSRLVAYHNRIWRRYCEPYSEHAA